MLRVSTESLNQNLPSLLLEGRPGVSPSCACPTRAFRGRALREKRGSPGLSSFLSFSPLLLCEIVLEGVAKVALYCAHRTSTVSPCAFCEQGGRLVTSSLTLGSESPPPPYNVHSLEPVRHCPSTTTKDDQAATLFSAPKNPQRIPANTELSLSPLKFPEQLPWLFHAAFFV